MTTALQIHDRTVHQPQAEPAAATAPKLKLDPPTIATECDPDQWSAFTRQWDMYKVGMTIAQNVLPTALFYFCDSDLRTDIMRDQQGNITNMSEGDLLNVIKRLDVRDESTIVQRMKLNKMMQTPGSSIRTFLASLRGQASLCQFKVVCKVPACDHVFDYSDEIIKDNLVRGIADPEILSDLLGDPKTDRTLEKTVSFIAQKEQGKITRSAVGDSASATFTTNQSQKPLQVSGVKFGACGGPSQVQRNDRKVRQRNCEAWTFTCAKCKVKDNYTTSCSKCSACYAWGHCDSSSRACTQGRGQRFCNQGTFHEVTKGADHDNVGYVYDQLCTTSEQKKHTASIEHHIFDGQWVARPPKPHPMLLVSMSPLPEDQASFGHPMKDTSKLRTIHLSMVADTGCQSTIIPLQTAKNLGITDTDLIPVKLVMRGAIKGNLGVIRAVVVSVTIRDGSSNSRSTCLLCYVSDVMERAFICREALISLGIIHGDFPNTPMDTLSDRAAVIDDEVTCSCPRRQANPPQLPTPLPPGLDATEENVDALKEWLLIYYGATTFNVCEHHPLPLMKCEPLRLHIDPEPDQLQFTSQHWCQFTGKTKFMLTWRGMLELGFLSELVKTPPHFGVPGWL